MSDESGAQALQQLLAKADRVYLDLLVDYITDDGKGRLMLSAGNYKTLVQAKDQGDYSTATLALLVSELLHFGGNSIANLWRTEGATWLSIVIDVLDHLKGKRQDGDSIVELERRVLVQLLEILWNKISAGEREYLRHNLKVEGMPEQEQIVALRAAVMEATDVGITVAQVLTTAMASTIFGAGAVFTGMSTGTAAVGATQFLAGRGALVILGPIGLALGGIWGTYNLTGPALRITIPCVVLIALIRLEMLNHN